mgnify:CR=1 FL=1
MATPRTPGTHIIEMEGWETTGYFVGTLRNSGLTIANGIDLSQGCCNTVDKLVAQGIPKANAEKWEKLGVLGKTYGQLIDGGKTKAQIEALALRYLNIKARCLKSQ